MQSVFKVETLTNNFVAYLSYIMLDIYANIVRHLQVDTETEKQIGSSRNSEAIFHGQPFKIS